MTKHIKPTNITINIKKLIKLPKSIIKNHFQLQNNQKTTYLFTKSPTNNLINNNFLYTNKNTLSLKLIYNLHHLHNTKKSIPQILKNFKQHPTITPLITNNKLIKYSTHIIPKTNINILPKLINNNILITNNTTKIYINLNFTIHNINLTITTKKTTTKTILSTIKNNNFNKQKLTKYHQHLKNNPLHNIHIYQKLPTFLNNPHIFNNYPKLTINITHNLFTINNNTPKLIHKKILHHNKKVNFINLIKNNIKKITIL